MPKEFKRHDRVGELIQRLLANYIRTELKDPRIKGLLTITAVQVTSDFSYAKVFVTVLGSDGQEMPEVLHYLNEAAPHLRKLLGKEIKIRTIPELRFIYDESVAYGTRLSKLINDAVAKDASKDDGS